jgi:hypothetical protein
MLPTLIPMILPFKIDLRTELSIPEQKTETAIAFPAVTIDRIEWPLVFFHFISPSQIDKRLPRIPRNRFRLK